MEQRALESLGNMAVTGALFNYQIRRCHMVKRLLLVGVILLLVSLLMVGCTVLPKEDYEALVAARDAVQAQVASLQSDLSEAQSQISSLESEVSSLQSIVSSLRNQISPLTSDLAAAERTITELRAAATEETVTPTPIAALSKDYSNYRFGFDYPDGFSVTEMGMFDSEANDNSGIVQVGIENDEFQMFQVMWFNITLSTWKIVGDLQAMLNATFEGMKVERAESFESVDIGELVETTKTGHEMVYQYYNVTYVGIKVYGIVAIFHCDESQRCYQIITANTTISAKEDVLEDFMNYLNSFVCH